MHARRIFFGIGDEPRTDILVCKAKPTSRGCSTARERFRHFRRPALRVVYFSLPRLRTSSSNAAMARSRFSLSSCVSKGVRGEDSRCSISTVAWWGFRLCESLGTSSPPTISTLGCTERNASFRSARLLGERFPGAVSVCGFELVFLLSKGFSLLIRRFYTACCATASLRMYRCQMRRLFL